MLKYNITSGGHSIKNAKLTKIFAVSVYSIFRPQEICCNEFSGVSAQVKMPTYKMGGPCTLLVLTVTRYVDNEKNSNNVACRPTPSPDLNQAIARCLAIKASYLSSE